MFGELKSVFDDDPTVDVLEKELLHVAHKGDVKRVRELVELIDNLNIHTLESYSFCPPDFDACTPLSLAIACGHFEIVKILVEAGADKDFYIGFDDSDSDECYCLNTPLFDAVHMRKQGLEIVKYLIGEGADFEGLPWHAVRLGDLEVLEYWFEIKAEYLRYLIWLKKSYDETIKNHQWVDDEKNDNEDTLLMCAAMFGNVETIKYLLSKGADPQLTNKKGKTAYIIATQTLKDEMLDRLKMNLNDVTEEIIEEHLKDYPNARSYIADRFEVVAYLDDVTTDDGKI